MGNFLRENWLYIVAPVVIVVVLLGALAIFTGGGGEGSPFIYNIF
jgi:VIT1/CCC1 family predicted Fe2+/Mn2+ transporter